MSCSRLPLAACLAASLMFMVGCQSSGTAPSASSAPTKAVLVTGQGYTTVYIPTSDGGVERLASSEGPECAQCKADAQHYFLTGQLTPKCSVCGATRVPLADYTKVGHQ